MTHYSIRWHVMRANERSVSFFLGHSMMGRVVWLPSMLPVG
ncbi:hypothetical protein PAMC26510_05390 [Caballeronia sordidicola]|uniref:Uncharacterized protein n=1 Tax=Caballeronia sordidicola TaxID=196367 RepID=A0A242N838_CABSO|nr:hypothetical protein PAMC26510_05390 [Caballeronia sordidicola]